MPSKKRKYNARFPAGRIKKIMQTDEEVGKVAQAVPVIICPIPRTLELFVESLLSKAMQVTMARNAKTLSPSHVKQCIVAESRFDFLRDLVKNIPDVSAAEEKEIISAESSPNSTRFPDISAPPRRIVREDSNSSSGSELRHHLINPATKEALKRVLCPDDSPNKPAKTETVTSAYDTALDLTKKIEVRTANFYQETLPDDVPHQSVITPNPTYASPQPSTSYTTLDLVAPVHRLEIPVPKPVHVDIRSTPSTPVTPIINIDFTKNMAIPEIKVLDSSVVVPKSDRRGRHVRQNSKHKVDVRKADPKPLIPLPQPVDIDSLNSGNLQIDEDYDT